MINRQAVGTEEPTSWTTGIRCCVAFVAVSVEVGFDEASTASPLIAVEVVQISSVEMIVGWTLSTRLRRRELQ